MENEELRMENGLRVVVGQGSNNGEIARVFIFLRYSVRKRYLTKRKFVNNEIKNENITYRRILFAACHKGEYTML
jgi:hypothetical protein